MRVVSIRSETWTRSTARVGNISRAEARPATAGKVVVAGDEEDGDALRGEPGDALGELALVGLGGVAVLVGVAGKEDGVDAVVDGVPD